jgi:hypothetical protein
MKNDLIQEVLSTVFNKLTVNSVEFFNVFGYKTAELTIAGLPKFGLGFYEANPSIKIFFLDDRYEPNDRYKPGGRSRYKEIVCVSRRVVDDDKKIAWNVEFTDETVLVENVGSFIVISKNMEAVLYVMQAIEIEENIFLKAM